MKTKLDITKIMDDYTDNEFFVEGEQAVDTEKAVNELLAQVKPRKKMKPVFKVLIAAAAAAVLAGTAAAATLVVSKQFTTPTNLVVFDSNGTTDIDITLYVAQIDIPIKVEEGNRLIFTAGGEHTDITDLVDENTPYIYPYVNTEGDTCYIIVGGAKGDYGYAELFPYSHNEKWFSYGRNSKNPYELQIKIPDGTEYASFEEMMEAVNEMKRSCYKPWYLTALDSLGLWDKREGHCEDGEDPVEFNKSFGYVYPDE